MRPRDAGPLPHRKARSPGYARTRGARRPQDGHEALDMAAGMEDDSSRRVRNVEKWVERVFFWGTVVLVVGFMLTGAYYLWIKPLLQ